MIETPALDVRTLAIIEWIWGVALRLVGWVVVPIVLALVSRLSRAAWRIERYFSRTRAAAVGIVQNTAHIPALDDTIAAAGPILGVAASIDADCDAIANLLLARAKAGSV